MAQGSLYLINPHIISGKLCQLSHQGSGLKGHLFWADGDGCYQFKERRGGSSGGGGIICFARRSCPVAGRVQLSGEGALLASVWKPHISPGDFFFFLEKKNSLYCLILFSYYLNIQKYRENTNTHKKQPIIPRPSYFC